MKTQFLFLILFFTTILSFYSCDRPVCNNTNPVFDNNAPDTKPYKAELAKQLGLIDQSKLSYWFDECKVSNGQDQLFFKLQGEGLCAMMVMNVEEWGKLEQLKKTKGMGYRGAQFTHLTFDIKHDSVKTEFVYRDFDKIID